MKTNIIARILKAHGIDHQVLSGRVLASSESGKQNILHVELVDLTGISLSKLQAWLGY